MSDQDTYNNAYEEGHKAGYAQGRIDLLKELTERFPENNMFHTPESRQQATAWCELQGPHATIGFMVSLNYTHHMISLMHDKELHQ